MFILSIALLVPLRNYIEDFISGDDQAKANLEEKRHQEPLRAIKYGRYQDDDFPY